MAGGMMGDGMDMTPPPPSSAMPGGGGGGGGGMGPMHGGGMMHMTFFWGKHVQVLFSGWPDDRGLGMYLLSLVFVLVAAALVECLSLAARLQARPTSHARRISSGLLLTALYTLQMGLAYLVMLAVMSFNVGVFMAAVAGHVLGFLVARSGLLRWSQHHEGPADCSGMFPSAKF